MPTITPPPGYSILSGMYGVATDWERANPHLASGMGGTLTPEQEAARAASQTQLNLNPNQWQQQQTQLMTNPTTPNSVWNNDLNQWDAPTQAHTDQLSAQNSYAPAQYNNLQTKPMNMGAAPAGMPPGVSSLDISRYGPGSSNNAELLGMFGGGAGGGVDEGSWSNIGTGYAPPAQLGNSPGMTPGTSGGGSWAGPSTNNPYMSGMANDIGRRTQLGLGQAFNQIRSNAVGVGGLGGSRQGVAQGIATGNAMDSQQGQLANLFGNQYNQEAGRELSRYGLDQNFYTAQRGQDQTGAALGANLFQQGQQGQWGPLNNANNIYGNYTGLGTTNNTQTSGGGWLGAAGGALGAAQMGSNLGWW